MCCVLCIVQLFSSTNRKSGDTLRISSLQLNLRSIKHLNKQVPQVENILTLFVFGVCYTVAAKNS